MEARARSCPRWPRRLGRRALDRPLVEHAIALGADGALDLVRDPEPLEQHVGPHAGVPVKSSSMHGEEVAHFLGRSVDPLSEGTTHKRVKRLFRFGKFCARGGTLRRVRPALAWLLFVLALAGCGASTQLSITPRPRVAAPARVCTRAVVRAG